MLTKVFWVHSVLDENELHQDLAVHRLYRTQTIQLIFGGVYTSMRLLLAFYWIKELRFEIWDLLIEKVFPVGRSFQSHASPLLQDIDLEL